tara:strand:+ start:102 stop:413 length:312 start_codon:yes stop_codon:yes gene_type:complete
MSRRYNFGELVPLSMKMEMKLPGSLVENGYAVSGPNEAGYYQIVGPELISPAFISGDVPFYHPDTGQLLYQPYIPPAPKEKPKSGFPLLGWVVLAVAIYLFVS